jgi:hypothetical protein
MADAVELFQLNRSGLWFKDTKILVKLIWHFGAWLVAELNLTKRLVQRLDHNKRLWVTPTFLNKKVALLVCVRCLSLRKSQTGDELSLFLFLEGEHSDEEEGVVKLIWHFGAWLVAELNRTKRLVQRLDHDKRLWVAPTFLNKKGSFVGLCQVLEPPQISNGR